MTGRSHRLLDPNGPWEPSEVRAVGRGYDCRFRMVTRVALSARVRSACPSPHSVCECLEPLEACWICCPLSIYSEGALGVRAKSLYFISNHIFRLGLFPATLIANMITMDDRLNQHSGRQWIRFIFCHPAVPCHVLTRNKRLFHPSQVKTASCS